MGRRGRPVDAPTRARVLDLHAAGRSRNAIARELNLSGSTVSRIVAEAGRSFDRAETRAATVAAVDDARARRARLAADLLADAERLRAQLWAPITLGAFGGRDNTWNEVRLAEPPPAEKRTILAAVHSAIRDHIELVRVDAARAEVDQVRGVLGDIMDGIRRAHAAAEPTVDAEAEPTPPEPGG